MRNLYIFIMLLLGYVVAMAQNVDTTDDDETVALDDPSFVPTVKVSKVIDKGDSIPYMEMSNVYVYPQLTFSDKKKMDAYMRLVKNVKKVLPIAKQVNGIIVETYEFVQTLPDQKSRDEHQKLVEKSIIKDYKPKMKKLTYSQGKLLIKLVYRECDSSSYDIVKAILGPVRAGFWQAFAWCFGANLKKGYDPEGTDRLTERVVLMVEAGQL